MTTVQTGRAALGAPRGLRSLAGVGMRKRRPSLKTLIVEGMLFLAAASSVAIMVGIIWTLVIESVHFFQNEEVTFLEYFTGTEWTPMFADPKFGVLPLISGTLVTTLVGLLLAVPVGTIVAVWLSEYASYRAREILKPLLELLSAVPTVVFGYFALLFVTPLLQKVIPDLPLFNMLSAGLVIGVMIIPYVASLSEDAMRAVPQALREGSYAMGATRMQTAWRVIYPGSLSGVTAAYILAISRALGETMVVAVAAGSNPNFTIDPREGASTITAFIVAVSLGDLPHESIGYQSIFAVGLTLMVMTLGFNIVGYLLRRRYREAY